MANNPHSQLRSSFTWDRRAKQIEPLPTTPNKQQIMPKAKKKNNKKQSETKRKDRRDEENRNAKKTTEKLIKAELIKHSKKLCYCNKMVSRCRSQRRLSRSRSRNREGNRIKQAMAEGDSKTLPNKLPGNPNSPRERERQRERWSEGGWATKLQVSFHR